MNFKYCRNLANIIYEKLKLLLNNNEYNINYRYCIKNIGKFYVEIEIHIPMKEGQNNDEAHSYLTIITKEFIDEFAKDFSDNNCKIVIINFDPNYLPPSHYFDFDIHCIKNQIIRNKYFGLETKDNKLLVITNDSHHLDKNYNENVIELTLTIRNTLTLLNPKYDDFDIKNGINKIKFSINYEHQYKNLE